MASFWSSQTLFLLSAPGLYFIAATKLQLSHSSSGGREEAGREGLLAFPGAQGSPNCSFHFYPSGYSVTKGQVLGEINEGYEARPLFSGHAPDCNRRLGFFVDFVFCFSFGKQARI